MRGRDASFILIRLIFFYYLIQVKEAMAWNDSKRLNDLLQSKLRFLCHLGPRACLSCWILLQRGGGRKEDMLCGNKNKATFLHGCGLIWFMKTVVMFLWLSVPLILLQLLEKPSVLDLMMLLIAFSFVSFTWLDSSYLTGKKYSIIINSLMSFVPQSPT